MSKPVPSITLTVSGLSAVEAAKIASACSALLATPAETDPDEILAKPNDATTVPTGHSYRELRDAHRNGDLDATSVPGGLRFTSEALAAYELKKQSRRRRGMRKAANDPVGSALERSGIVITKKTGSD